jgi:ribosomal protein S18 acetylase RimI-like enzyme
LPPGFSADERPPSNGEWRFGLRPLVSEQVDVRIRPFREADWAGVWAVLEPIFRAGETYAFPRDIGEEDARRRWTAPAHEVFVVEEPITGELLGTYFLKPNHDGPGAHVCNCGYAVAAGARGRGVATLMCRHSQEHAASRGFRAMQFNLVVATNEGAVRLWAKLGFEIVGTLPGVFQHPRQGFVDAYVMFKSLPGPD